MVMDHKNKYSDLYACNTVMFVVMTFVLFLTSKSHGASIAKTSSGRYHGTSSVQPDIGTDSSCEQLPTAVLSEILGPAFNSRYMSITAPNKADVKVNRNKGATDMKRMVSTFPPFYVDDDYALDLGNEPAWDVKYSKLNTLEPVVESDVEENTSRRKRATSRPWSCEAKIKWVNLGPDYFPRHLRTVECTQHDCWYGHYTCQPRSFAVRILRRRSGVCVNSDPMKKIGVAGLPGELRELWVWEERAVNFCCDCAAK